MADKRSMQRLRISVFVSVAFNTTMVVTGTLANMLHPLAWMSFIARAIAAPPGFFLGWVARPGHHSVLAFGLAAAEGFVGSLVFYGLASWAVLWLYDLIFRSRKQPGAA